MQPSRALIGIAKALAVALILVWSLVPIAFIVVSAVKPSADIFAVPPRLLFAPTFKHFVDLWAQWRGFFTGLVNSAIVTAGVTLLAVVASTMAGYAYSRSRSPGMARSALFLVAVRL